MEFLPDMTIPIDGTGLTPKFRINLDISTIPNYIKHITTSSNLLSS